MTYAANSDGPLSVLTYHDEMNNIQQLRND